MNNKYLIPLYMSKFNNIFFFAATSDENIPLKYL